MAAERQTAGVTPTECRLGSHSLSVLPGFADGVPSGTRLDALWFSRVSDGLDFGRIFLLNVRPQKVKTVENI